MGGLKEVDFLLWANHLNDHRQLSQNDDIASAFEAAVLHASMAHIFISAYLDCFRQLSFQQGVPGEP